MNRSLAARREPRPPMRGVTGSRVPAHSLLATVTGVSRESTLSDEICDLCLLGSTLCGLISSAEFLGDRVVKKFLVQVVLFGVMGAASVAAFYHQTNKAKAEMAAADPDARVTIPMALGDIPAGTFITEEMLGMGPVFSAKLPRTVLRSYRVIVGRVAKVDIEMAQPIQTDELYLPQSEKVIPFGERVRVVVANDRVVEGELLKMVGGWVRVRNDDGREVSISVGPGAMFEVIGEDDATPAISTIVVEETPPPADSEEE